MEDIKRGTGRTERMLFDAVNTGIGKHRFRKVIILCDNPVDLKRIACEWFNIAIVNRLIFKKFELKTYHAIHNDIDFKPFVSREHGWDVAQVYVDHYVVQKYRESFVPTHLVQLECAYDL